MDDSGQFLTGMWKNLDHMSGTSARTLQLLSLLQTHRFWAGDELAGRLEVSERTLRRDVERLRDLGYPVTATRGAHGGYQLGQGASLPPLTIDEDEAIALVSALTTQAGGVTGATADATLAVLSKVVQVLPRRLRHRAEAVRATTDGASFAGTPEVDSGVLGTVALAARDHERLRFTYTARGGQAAGTSVDRHVEPHRLVTVGRRWYLLAHDLERHDWRSFRLDRMSDPTATGARFRERPIPGDDAAAYVRAGLSRRDREVSAVVDVEASREHVEALIGPWAEIVSADDRSVRLEVAAHSPDWTLFALGRLEAPFTVVSAPQAVVDAIGRWSGRFGAATG